MTASHALRQLEKEADVVYREAVRGLFSDEKVDAKMLLREKQASRKDGERLSIRGGSGRAVRRTLELAGVDSLLRDD